MGDKGLREFSPSASRRCLTPRLRLESGRRICIGVKLTNARGMWRNGHLAKGAKDQPQDVDKETKRTKCQRGECASSGVIKRLSMGSVCFGAIPDLFLMKREDQYALTLIRNTSFSFYWKGLAKMEDLRDRGILILFWEYHTWSGILEQKCGHVEDEKKELVRDVHMLARLGVQLVDSTKGGIMVHHSSESTFVVDVTSKQHLDPILMELKESVLNKSVEAFSQGGMGCLGTKISFSVEDYAKLYINEIVKLHGVPLSIISNLGALFTSHFWKEFQKVLDTNVKLSTAFNPQTDGQAERTIQTLEDVVRACVIGFKGSWDDHLPLIEFSYNNNYHSSIAIAPFEALYRRRCRSLVGWFEVGEFALIGPELVYEAIEKVQLIRERFGKTGKLSPRYVGPYQILKRVGKVAYELNLPNELAPVHPVFHVSMLKKCIGDPISILLLEGLGVDKNLSYEEVPIEILDRQVKRLRNKEVASVKVLWRNSS
ncbi:hypothetical protein MTR67_035565 [Solanum verrucosum]|uniref:Integrase catalytic domain-containing protein n=1 Tax=Solanum verrucosum TaxID=315347 RepID=A0AAF0UAG5_SOLVR|nr:hypothetical protein MTR67_035565 [Solanum verrucosum]